MENFLGWADRNKGKLAAALLVAALLSMSQFKVREYERGVVTTWGRLSYVASPGVGFKIPILQSVEMWRIDANAIRVSEGMKNGKEDGINTYTIDNQEVDVVATVQYRIDPDKVAHVYANFQNYERRLYEMAVDRVKSEMGKVNITHVAEQRGKIRDAVEEIIKRDAAVMGITVADFQLTNLEYQPAFRAAVASAATAKAQIDQREYERQQAEKAAQTAKTKAEGEANAARETAKGKADAIDAVAKAEARAIQVKGEAQAAAMRAQANALQANPHLVAMKIAEQWKGDVPQWVGSQGSVPLINLQAPAK
jgi:regulator of protease activity HflC (stomatin/prohibitin superfamily)